MELLKWILVFGNENESVTVVAAFPKQFESELSEQMLARLLTSTWNTEKSVAPTEGLSFTLTEAGEMKLAKRIGNSLVYTKGGAIPSEGADVPVFVIAQSMAKTNIEDPESLAKLSVLQNTSVTDTEIEQSVKVLIDGLSGYEIVAKALDAKSGQPTIIYQTMLYEGQSYYLMLGMVGSQQREVYVPAFKEMAGSFRRN